MKQRGMLDEDEKELIAAYERGELRAVKDQGAARKMAEEAARRYTRKDARINIRISTADLEMLKARAAEEGLAYQSLIASILHKYVSGRGGASGGRRVGGPRLAGEAGGRVSEGA